MNLHACSRARTPSTGTCRCRQSLPIRLRRSVICCFPATESSNINSLVLIPFFLARATRAGASPPEAPATRAAGRAASPTPGGACPILSPGRSARRRCRICSIASRICCGRSLHGCCRLRPLPSTRRASWDRPGVVAHGRRFPAGAVRHSDGRCARRDRAGRGRAHRTAGARPVARAPAPRTVGVRSTHPTRRADRWVLTLAGALNTPAGTRGPVRSTRPASRRAASARNC